PARDLPLAELARPANSDVEIGKAESRPPHLDPRPAAAGACPYLAGEPPALQAEGRIVAADVERLIGQTERVLEATRGNIDVSEIRANERAEQYISQGVGEWNRSLSDLGGFGEPPRQPVGRHQGGFDVQSTARVALPRCELAGLHG